jgi:RNA polymerase sigma-70 factor (ECF subfamily)
MSKRMDPARQIAVKAEALDLRALFDKHYASIWRLLRRLGLPAAQIDDATQEVFWVAARRLSDIEPGRDGPFLLRVAAGEMRRLRAAMPLVEIAQAPSMIDEGPSPEDQLVARQARRLLDDVLDRMPGDLRTVFVLHELEGIEVREIAALEEIPVGTASSRLRRAREEFSAISKRVRAGLMSRGGRSS